MQKACKWEETTDLHLVRGFLASVEDPELRGFYQKGYILFYKDGEGRPDDINECAAVKVRMQPRVDEARARFKRFEPPKPVTPAAIQPPAIKKKTKNLER